MRINLNAQFTTEGQRRLPTGRLMSATFTAELPAGEILRGVAVSLRIAVDEQGEPHCTDVHLEAEEGGELTWRDLRGFPLERLVNAAFATAAASGMTDEAIPGGRRLDALTATEADAAFDAALAASTRRKPRSLDDDFLQDVADAYREALEHGDAKVRRGPTRYVALRLGGGTDHRGEPTSYHAAKMWVGKARTAGYLPTTSSGRKAG